MKMHHDHTATVILIVLMSFPASSWGAVHNLTVAGERLEYVAQPERGYVVKLAPDAGGIHALAGVSALDAEDATPVGGSDRRGVWVVENDGLAGENEETIRSLHADRRIAYAAPLFSSNGETVAIIPEIVIRMKPGVALEEVQATCTAAGCTIRKRMEFTEQEYLLEILGLDADAVFAAVEQLNHAPEVEWACPNTAFQPRLYNQLSPTPSTPVGQLPIVSAAGDPNAPGVFPNDEYFPNQWHLYNTGQSGGTPGADIRAPEAWEITTGDPNIVVAVIDTGVDTNHPDLVNNLVAGYDYIDNDDQPYPSLDDAGGAHGTSCAGLVAAQGNNGIGVSGVTWNCKVMPNRVHIEGATWISEADIATAFRWAASQGADILSNSWGFSSPLPIIHSAIIDVTEPLGIGRNGKGCAVLFAAGNYNISITGYPQKYPEVILVGGTDHNDQRCWYSNYGPELDIVAPSGGGVRVANLWEEEYVYEYLRLSTDLLWTTDILGASGFSTFNENSDLVDYTEKASGTSSACPVAAGVAALILSVEPNLNSDEVRYFLERSAKDLGDPGRDNYYGWGRVDARAALDMVLAKRADLNNDWTVNLADLVILIEAWGSNDSSADVAPAAKRDGIVDEQDLALLMEYWQTVIPVMPEPGLIDHWKLDETEGLVAHDSTGKNDGTLMGAPVWQPEAGAIDGALALDGVDDYVVINRVVNPGQGPFSVFAWIKGGGPGQVIVSQQSGANWLRADTSEGRLMTELGATATGSELHSETAIIDGDWHRIGFTWNGSTRALYVDDVRVAEDAQTGLAGSFGRHYVGCAKDCAAGTFFSGLVDDIRLYNRAVKP